MDLSEKYERLYFMEFLEFLVRATFLKFDFTQEEFVPGFSARVEKTIDWLFKEIYKGNEAPLERVKPEFEIEVSSESDYDSDD